MTILYDHQPTSDEMNVLIRYKGKQGTELGFGITRIQREFRIGYNKAYTIIEKGIKLGILVRQKDNNYPHQVKFTTTDIAELT